MQNSISRQKNTKKSSFMDMYNIDVNTKKGKEIKICISWCQFFVVFWEYLYLERSPTL